MEEDENITGATMAQKLYRNIQENQRSECYIILDDVFIQTKDFFNIQTNIAERICKRYYK